MNKINASPLLTEMRALANTRPMETTKTAAGFSDILTQMVNQANEKHIEADKLAEAFSLGDDHVELSSVIIAREKSTLAFTLLAETVKRGVACYQEMMNMPL